MQQLRDEAAPSFLEISKSPVGELHSVWYQENRIQNLMFGFHQVHVVKNRGALTTEIVVYGQGTYEYNMCVYCNIFEN